MRSLIRFWTATIDKNRWLMDSTTREMIQETIRVLKVINKDNNTPQVQKELREIQDSKRRL